MTHSFLARLSALVSVAAACGVILLARQQDRFRSEASYVEFSFVATGANGRAVTDLTSADVAVTEDGHPQTIASFVHRQTKSAGDGTPRFVLAANQTSVAETKSRNAYLVAVDMFHTSLGNRRRIDDAIRLFTTRYVHADDLVAIVILGVDPRASIFSSNPRVYAAALSAPSESGRVAEGKIDLGTAEATTAFTDGGSVASAIDAERSLGQLTTAVKTFMELRSVRKSVLIFSEGIGVDLYPGASPQNRDATERVLRAQREFLQVANAADVSVYPIDIRGMAAIDPFSEGVPAGLQEWQSLRVLADFTGGVAFVGRTKMEPVFEAITSEATDYYQVGYYSTQPADKGLHHVDISSVRPKVSVRSRSSAPSLVPHFDGKAVESLSARDLLSRALPVSDQGIRLRVTTTAVPKDGNSTLQVKVEILNWNEISTVLAGHADGPHTQVGVALFDPFGKRLLERLAEVPGRSKVLTTSIQIPQGASQLRAGVVLEGGRLSGSVLIDIDNAVRR